MIKFPLLLCHELVRISEKKPLYYYSTRRNKAGWLNGKRNINGVSHLLACEIPAFSFFILRKKKSQTKL